MPTDLATPTRVLLLRHAETAAPDRFHGAESDVGLGARGFEQAEAAGLALARLGPVAVYSSAMLRARQTAGAIARPLGVEPVAVADLHERIMGPLSGARLVDGWDAYVAAMEAWKGGDLGASHAGGESFLKIRDRVVPPFDGLARAHPGRTIAVVAHGIVIRVLLSSLLGGEGASGFDRFGIDFVAVNDLRLDARGWTAAALNRPADAMER